MEDAQAVHNWFGDRPFEIWASFIELIYKIYEKLKHEQVELKNNKTSDIKRMNNYLIKHNNENKKKNNSSSKAIKYTHNETEQKLETK